MAAGYQVRNLIHISRQIPPGGADDRLVLQLSLNPDEIESIEFDLRLRRPHREGPKGGKRGFLRIRMTSGTAHEFAGLEEEHLWTMWESLANAIRFLRWGDVPGNGNVEIPAECTVASVPPGSVDGIRILEPAQALPDPPERQEVDHAP